MSEKQYSYRNNNNSKMEYIPNFGFRRIKRGSFGYTLPNRKVINFKTLDDRSLFIKYINSLKEPFHIFIKLATEYAKKIQSGLVGMEIN